MVLNGKVVGETPVVLNDLPVGSRAIVVRHEGQGTRAYPLRLPGAVASWTTDRAVTYAVRMLNDGAAVVKASALTLSALGSYTTLAGQPSMFVYAVLDYPIGGPAFTLVAQKILSVMPSSLASRPATSSDVPPP